MYSRAKYDFFILPYLQKYKLTSTSCGSQATRLRPCKRSKVKKTKKFMTIKSYSARPLSNTMCMVIRPNKLTPFVLTCEQGEWTGGQAQVASKLINLKAKYLLCQRGIKSQLVTLCAVWLVYRGPIKRLFALNQDPVCYSLTINWLSDKRVQQGQCDTQQHTVIARKALAERKHSLSLWLPI